MDRDLFGYLHGDVGHAGAVGVDMALLESVDASRSDFEGGGFHGGAEDVRSAPIPLPFQAIANSSGTFDLYNPAVVYKTSQVAVSNATGLSATSSGHLYYCVVKKPSSSSDSSSSSKTAETVSAEVTDDPSSIEDAVCSVQICKLSKKTVTGGGTATDVEQYHVGAIVIGGLGDGGGADVKIVSGADSNIVVQKETESDGTLKFTLDVYYK